MSHSTKNRLKVYFCFLLLAAAMVSCKLTPTPKKGDPLVNNFLFHTEQNRVTNWAEPDFEYEDVTLITEDNVKIHAWYLPAPEQNNKPKTVVLFSHGNAGNVRGWSSLAGEEMRKRFNVSVLVYDYRGYGKSEGWPSVPGILKDGRAARDWLCQRESIKPNEIVYCGRSLGGAVAVNLAAETGAKGLILESTFTSLPAIAKKFAPLAPTSLIRYDLDSLESIKKYTGPLLHCHGDADATVPYTQGVELFDACPSKSKTFVRMVGLDHNDTLTEDYRERQRQFFEEIGEPSTKNE